MSQTMSPGGFVPPTLTQASLLSTSLSKKAAPLKKTEKKTVERETHGHVGKEGEGGVLPGEVQNARSRAILQQYYQTVPNVPIDPRNGLDMRTLCTAQDASYLGTKKGPGNTYETTTHARRPYYEGSVVNKLRDGWGKCVYSNTYFSYEGSWQKGMMHKEGRLMLGDGGFYEGEFSENEITGMGVRHWADGSHYSGHFKDGEMDGHGLLVKATGDKYEGSFRRNQRWGSGVLVTADGSRFDGDWAENKLNGHGTQEGADGSHYVGAWVNGKWEGFGELHKGDGDKFKGTFLQHEKSGQGVMFHASSGITYDCDWLHDEPVVRPEQFKAEVQELLEWVPRPPKPPPEEDEEAAPEEEEEPDEPPPSLKQLLEQPVAAGEVFPTFLLMVTDKDGKVQAGESGRLVELCAGIFEEIIPPTPEHSEEELGRTPSQAAAAAGAGGEEGEAVPPPNPPEYKLLATPPFPIFIQPAKKSTADDAAEVSEEVAQAAKEEEEEKEEGALVGVGQEYQLKREYPPSYILGGLKIVKGQLKIEGLTIPEGTPDGEYRLKISSTFQSPFVDIKPIYIDFKVG